MARASDEPHRVALLGYGLAGAVFHAPLIETTPGLRLVAVVTSAPGRQEQARGRHPEARVLGRVDDVWEGEGKADLVVFATPNRTHVPLGLAAIGAGLAVVVDRPLALTAAEARRLIAVAAKRRVPLTVFQNRRQGDPPVGGRLSVAPHTPPLAMAQVW